jgi:hypothetical protein
MRLTGDVPCVMSGERIASNENKMSDGGRERGSRGVGVRKSSQNVDAERSAVRSSAWLGDWRAMLPDAEE